MHSSFHASVCPMRAHVLRPSSRPDSSNLLDVSLTSLKVRPTTLFSGLDLNHAAAGCKPGARAHSTPTRSMLSPPPPVRGSSLSSHLVFISMIVFSAVSSAAAPPPAFDPSVYKCVMHVTHVAQQRTDRPAIPCHSRPHFFDRPDRPTRDSCHYVRSFPDRPTD